jgi:IclR family transcriptional regulator, KDG regulon repressor
MASLKQAPAKNRAARKQAVSIRHLAAVPVQQPAKSAPAKSIIVTAPPKEPSTAMLERGFDLLEILAKDGPTGIEVLSSKAGCAALTATRLLRVLQTKGFAVFDEATKSWRLGTRWTAFGQAAVEQDSLATTAMPFLTALGVAAGENAYLRVRDGMASETIAVYRTDPTLRVYTEVGSRGPLHAGTSRMLLAHAPESVQTQLLTQRLPRFTPATRTDPTWIAADLQRIRARGYLVTADEVVPGAVSVGAPVRDASGNVVAVIFISAPTMRMRPPRPRALVSIVQDAAAKLSHALGYTRSETMLTAAPVPRKPGAPAWSVPSPAMTIKPAAPAPMARAG